MSHLILPRRQIWTSQPQGLVKINPQFGAGLALTGPAGKVDLARNSTCTVSGTLPKVVNKFGIATRFDSASNLITVARAGASLFQSSFAIIYQFQQIGTVQHGGSILNDIGTGANANALWVYTLSSGLLRADVFDSSGGVPVTVDSAAIVANGYSYTAIFVFDRVAQIAKWIINGVVSGTPVSISSFAGRNNESGSFVIAGPVRNFAPNHDVSLLAVIPSKIDGALANNPWQILKRPDARIFVPVSAGGATASFTNTTSAASSTLAASVSPKASFSPSTSASSALIASVAPLASFAPSTSASISALVASVSANASFAVSTDTTSALAAGTSPAASLSNTTANATSTIAAASGQGASFLITTAPTTSGISASVSPQASFLVSTDAIAALSAQSQPLAVFNVSAAAATLSGAAGTVASGTISVATDSATSALSASVRPVAEITGSTVAAVFSGSAFSGQGSSFSVSTESAVAQFNAVVAARANFAASTDAAIISGSASNADQALLGVPTVRRLTVHTAQKRHVIFTRQPRAYAYSPLQNRYWPQSDG